MKVSKVSEKGYHRSAVYVNCWLFILVNPVAHTSQSVTANVIQWPKENYELDQQTLNVQFVDFHNNRCVTKFMNNIVNIDVRPLTINPYRTVKIKWASHFKNNKKKTRVKCDWKFCVNIFFVTLLLTLRTVTETEEKNAETNFTAGDRLIKNRYRQNQKSSVKSGQIAYRATTFHRHF